MAQPVWVLSVDLQTKTATFNSGMSEAAKTARGAFTDIKSGSNAMGAEVGTSMGEARHGVMLLGEEFGVHLPRGLTTFIASIGPVGAAMEAAFPFLAIALGATLLIEHLTKMHEAGEKLTEDQMKFGTSVQTVFNNLDDKLLQAGIRTDDLRNNHVGALAKQLQLIDNQSMAELAQQFGALAKIADSVFADLKKSWYQFGAGSAGAKASLDSFQSAYDAMLAKGDDKGAAAMLEGKVAREQKILDIRKEAANTSQAFSGAGADPAKFAEHQEALNKLKEYGGGFDKDEIAAGQTLLDTLSAQVTVQTKVGQLKTANSANAKTESNKSGEGQASAAAKEAAESQMRIAQLLMQSDRAQANAALEIGRASADEREAVDIDFADRELAIQMQGNQAQVNALDKGGKDYSTQLKGLHEKAEELTQQHATKLVEISSRAQVEQAAKDLQNTEQSERETIEATEQGSAARLAAIDAALHSEQALNLQDTSHYRELMTQRVGAARQEAEEEGKLKAEAGQQAAEEGLKAGQLAIAAQKEKQALENSIRLTDSAQLVAQAIKNADAEYAVAVQANQKEAAALDKGAKDYQQKLAANYAKEKQMAQAHENEVAAIKTKAEIATNDQIMASAKHFNDTMVSGLSQVLMGHKSFASIMSSIGNQVVTGMIENAIKAEEANLMGKESDAAKAARKAYNIGISTGGPAGMVLGPTFAALAFAGVSAFQDGTDRVPGIGSGDTVPAMLEPGEGVVPGGVMDSLRGMARSGNMGGGGDHYHAHVSPVYHMQAMDTDGMDGLLKKHSSTIAKHVGNEMRKLNH